MMMLSGCSQPATIDTARSGRADGEVASVQQRQQRARAWFRKGLETKDLAEKERRYVEALREWPGYPEAHNNLGDVYEKQQRYDEALREYQIAAALAPSLASAWLGAGDVYFTLGQNEAAIRAYEKGLALERDELSLRRLKLARSLSATIQFAFDSTQLTERAKAKLREVAAALADPEVKSASFVVEGHTDSIGSEAYNSRLAKGRAERVRGFLVHNCMIDSGRFALEAYGEDRPLSSNETAEGRARNRRVQFRRR